MSRAAGITYLFATDSKRAKSCSDWSACGSKSREFLMMSKACIFHRGSRGITKSSSLKKKERIVQLTCLPGLASLSWLFSLFHVDHMDAHGEKRTPPQSTALQCQSSSFSTTAFPKSNTHESPNLLPPQTITLSAFKNKTKQFKIASLMKAFPWPGLVIIT